MRKPDLRTTHGKNGVPPLPRWDNDHLHYTALVIFEPCEPEDGLLRVLFIAGKVSDADLRDN